MNVPFALAATVARRFVPARIVTRVATPAPPCVTRPERRLTPLTLRPESVIPPGAITAGETTVAAVFTVPTPAFYGVQNATHAPCTTGPMTPFSVRSALRNFAPNVAPHLVRGKVRRRQAEHELCRAERRLRAARREDVRGQVDRLARRLEHQQERQLRRHRADTCGLRRRSHRARGCDDDVAREGQQRPAEREGAHLRLRGADFRARAPRWS